MRNRFVISESLWEKIAPLMPDKVGDLGATDRDHRLCFWKLRFGGCAWAQQCYSSIFRNPACPATALISIRSNPYARLPEQTGRQRRLEEKPEKQPTRSSKRHFKSNNNAQAVSLGDDHSRKIIIKHPTYNLAKEK